MTTIPPSQETCPNPETLVEFVEGNLVAEQRLQVEEHISLCELCRVATSTLVSLDRPQSTEDDLLSEAGRVDRYEIEGRIGAGASGIVYQAFDPKLKRQVAIKVIYARSDQASDAIAQERAFREAQAIARISHPNVINIFDVGTWQGHMFLAMEWVDGTDLLEWLDDHTLDATELARIFSECARGLQAAHDADVLHRDFKPANVLIGRDGRVRVTDFGLAHFGLSAASPLEVQDTENPRITHTHGVIGTPVYMAPEQYEDGAVTDRTEQFSLCVSLWEAIHGVRPFDIRDSEKRYDAIVAGTLPVHETPRAMASLARIAVRGLSADPADRYSSMAELAAVLSPAPKTKGGLRWALVGLVVSLALASMYLVFATSDVAEESCAQRAGVIDGIWNDETRVRLRAAFKKTGVSFANDALLLANERLDSTAHDWRITRKTVCDASGSREEKRTQRNCLTRDLTRLEAQLGAWRKVDQESIVFVADAVDTLPDPTLCLDPEILLRRQDQVANAEEESALLALQERLAKAVALRAIGKHPTALSQLRGLAKKAQQTEFVSFQTDVLLELSRALTSMDLPEEALETLQRAAEMAEANHFDHRKARAWISLAEVASSDLAKLERGQAALQYSEAAIARLGKPPLLIGSMLFVRGKLQKREGDFAAAQTSFEKALVIETTVPETLRRRYALASILHTRGAHEESLVQYKLVVTEYRRVKGETHPSVAAALNGMFGPFLLLGRVDEARDALEEALGIFENVYGVDHSKTRTVMSNLAIVFGMSGESKRAVAIYEKLLPLEEASDRANLPHVANWYMGAGSAYVGMGDPNKAAEYFGRAERIYATQLGPTHLHVALAMTAGGDVLRKQGNYEMALARGQAALAIQQVSEAPPPRQLAQAQLLVVRSWIGMGVNNREVKTMARAALPYFESDPSPAGVYAVEVLQSVLGKMKTRKRQR